MAKGNPPAVGIVGPGTSPVKNGRENPFAAVRSGVRRLPVSPSASWSRGEGMNGWPHSSASAPLFCTPARCRTMGPSAEQWVRRGILSAAVRAGGGEGAPVRLAPSPQPLFCAAERGKGATATLPEWQPRGGCGDTAILLLAPARICGSKSHSHIHLSAHCRPETANAAATSVAVPAPRAGKPRRARQTHRQHNPD